MSNDITISYKEIASSNCARKFKPGLYFVYDASELLYIGKAADIKARLNRHLVCQKTGLGKFLAKDREAVNRLTVVIRETNARDLYEAFWITELKPRLNSTEYKIEYGPELSPVLRLKSMIERYRIAAHVFPESLHLASMLKSKALCILQTEHKLNEEILSLATHFEMNADFAMKEKDQLRALIVSTAKDLAYRFGVDYLRYALDCVAEGNTKLIESLVLLCTKDTLTIHNEGVIGLD